MKIVMMALVCALLTLSVPLTAAQAQNNGLSMDDVMNQAVTKRSQQPSANNNTGITVNKSRQQMQQGYGSGNTGCMWDGGHDMFGVPGSEVPVVCKCNGEIATDSNCSSPKPGGNYYYGR